MGNSKKTHGMLRTEVKYPAGHPNWKFLTVLLENCEKAAVKHSPEKPALLNFVNLSKILTKKRLKSAK